VCCVQRNILSLDGALVMPQEFVVENFMTNIHSMLAVICVTLLVKGI
jgi:hypothetical protein